MGKNRGPITRPIYAQTVRGRGGRIRTDDPLHPMQVRYRAAPRPDIGIFYQIYIGKSGIPLVYLAQWCLAQYFLRIPMYD